MVTRGDLQTLAQSRLDEAKKLLDNGFWSGAYYLAGYAVECAIKASIAAKMKADVFPDKKFADKCYTHEIPTLINLAELNDKRAEAVQVNPSLGASWSIVSQWRETARYETKTQSEAQSLYDAISDPTNGVLQWMKIYW